jgi:hypothetical protein
MHELFKQFIAFATLCALSLSAAWAQISVGEVVRASGAANIKRANGPAQAVKAKDEVFVADTVTTEGDGQIMIRLKDKSTMLVRPKSQMVIEDFKFEKKPDDRISANVVSGAMRAVTGEIAKDKPSNVKYSAGTATIGIRGTDIELAIIEDGQKDRAGVYNYVYSGLTEMALASGEKVSVEKELTGFTPAKLNPGEAPLQVLRDRPAFLQSSGFDALLQQLTTPRIPMIR